MITGELFSNGVAANPQQCRLWTPITRSQHLKQPNNPLHPGEMLIEEFLEPMGMTQVEFARQLGSTKARLNKLIRRKRDITSESALNLAEALGTSPKLWMNLQATSDLDRAISAREEDKVVRRRIPV